MFSTDVNHKVYCHFSKSVLLVASLIESCVLVNQKAREELLNGGFCFCQVALLEKWLPFLSKKVCEKI